MKSHTDRYILECLQHGILTKRDLHKYPLRKYNLACVLKTYAISMNMPYTLHPRLTKHMPDTDYYLTVGGFEWMLFTLKQYSFAYLKSTFPLLYAAAKADCVADPTYEMYGNFRGVVGEAPKAGTKQKAILVHRKGRVEHEYKFDTLREARKEVISLTRFYPASAFTLYRIRKNTKRGKVSYYKSKVPLILEPTNRGKHLRGDNHDTH